MGIFSVSLRTYTAFIIFLHGSLLMAESEVLEPMEVSALRLETDSSNLPARIEFIGEAEIRQSGAMDLAELLRREANLQVRSYSANSARSTVSMGGFGENGGLRTLVLLDGHRLNAIDMSPIDWYSIPLVLVDSIEVIRGGQSGAYGNHAVGGVIKINTKLPKLEPSLSLETSGGSFDSFNTRGSYSQMIGEIGFTIFGERAESDGYRENGDHQTDAGGIRLDWGIDSDLTGYASWSLSDSYFGLAGSLDAVQMLEDRRQTTSPHDYVEERSSHSRIGIRYQINENWRLDKRFGLQNREVNENYPDWSWFTEKVYRTFSYSPELHYSSNSADWMIGVDFSEDELESSNNLEYKRETTGFITSTGLKFSNHWNLNGNFRIERHENSGDFQANKNEWAAGVGLIRDFGLGKRAFAAIRRFYRYPAIDEYTLANGLLEPESGYEVELGMDWSINQISLSGRIFRQWMDDEIILDPNAGGFFGQNINLPKNSRLGLDLSMDWQMTESLRSGLSYEYVNAQFEEGDYSDLKVPLVPEGLLRLFLELSPMDSLLLSLGGSFVGESFRGSDFSNNQEKMEDYWLYDLRMNYELSERATVFGGCDNLFDKEYVSTAFGTGLYPGEGRKATIGLRYSF